MPLLLPAVQTARDSSRRDSETSPPAKDLEAKGFNPQPDPTIDDFMIEDPDQQVDLLLPANQSAREASRDDDGPGFGLEAEG